MSVFKVKSLLWGEGKKKMKFLVREGVGERGRHFRRIESMNDLISETGGTSAPSLYC